MYFIAYLYIISITTTFKINNKHKLYKLTKSWKKSNKPYISEQKDIFDLHWKCTCTTLLPNRFSAYQYLLCLFLYMPLWWKSIYNKICISKQQDLYIKIFIMNWESKVSFNSRLSHQRRKITAWTTKNRRKPF